MYKGKSIAEIADIITITEGYRYLTELAILNEKEKSKLEEISDRSIEQESSIGRASSNPSMINSLSNSIKQIYSFQIAKVSMIEESKQN